MKPSSLKRIERELKDLMSSDGDNCSICQRKFAFNDLTFGGVSKGGKSILTGECCNSLLASEIIRGLFVSRDFPISGASDNASAKRQPPAVIDESIAAARSLGRDIEKQRSKASARAGIDPDSTIVRYSTAEWQHADAQWFESHPTRSHRLRTLIGAEKGSFQDIDSQDLPVDHEIQVLVRQIEPGMRVRFPVGRNLAMPIPDTEEVLHAIFDIFSRRGGSTIITPGDVIAAISASRPAGNA